MTANLTGADDAFGLAQEVPVRGDAEVAGALEMKERRARVWIRATNADLRRPKSFLVGKMLLKRKKKNLISILSLTNYKQETCLSRFETQKQLCPPSWRQSIAPFVMLTSRHQRPLRLPVLIASLRAKRCPGKSRAARRRF